MPKRHLTVCESEVMNVVWDRGEVTVQDVVNGISRPLAYTTGEAKNGAVLMSTGPPCRETLHAGVWSAIWRIAASEARSRR